MKRSRVFAFWSSNPSSHKMRDMTRSSVEGSGSLGLSGTRLRKIVPPGMSPPIFVATQNRPVGVFMLPCSRCSARRELSSPCPLCFAQRGPKVTIDMLMGNYHIAVVGATGAAGTELLRVLERRNFPVASLRAIGSARSAGKSVRFRGESVPVEKLDDRCFDKIDIAFFSAGGSVSRNYVPIAF